MATLTFEEKGLLRLLEGIRGNSAPIGPSVRFALLQRNLIEPGEPARLTAAGAQVLEDLLRLSSASYLARA